MRITGTVLKTDFITGTSVTTNRPYAFHAVRILGADAEVYDVTINTNPQPVPVPAAGELVDYDVRVSTQRNSERVNINVAAVHVDREPIAV